MPARSHARPIIGGCVGPSVHVSPPRARRHQRGDVRCRFGPVHCPHGESRSSDCCSNRRARDCRGSTAHLPRRARGPQAIGGDQRGAPNYAFRPGWLDRFGACPLAPSGEGISSCRRTASQHADPSLAWVDAGDSWRAPVRRLDCSVRSSHTGGAAQRKRVDAGRLVHALHRAADLVRLVAVARTQRPPEVDSRHPGSGTYATW